MDYFLRKSGKGIKNTFGVKYFCMIKYIAFGCHPKMLQLQKENAEIASRKGIN